MIARESPLQMSTVYGGNSFRNICIFLNCGETIGGMSERPDPIIIPILRTFPGPEAERFYVQFLGFSIDWDHRYEAGMPLYRQVSKDGIVLHLSEHHGDATPGSALRIQVPDVRALQRQLEASTVYPLRIGLSHEPWGEDLDVPDPFGNRLIFHTPKR